MKKLLILSGKGGTGKTTTAAAFSHFSKAKALADCDVDAPNLHLLMERKTAAEEADFYGSEIAHINQEKCMNCGKCFSLCRFHAIEKTNDHFKVNESACEGCGLCEIACPNQAINMVEDVSGHLDLYRDTTVFSTAKLKMGRGNTGKLVSEVKNRLFQTNVDSEIAIIDGSPGIGCPVISSISGMDLVIIVVEPSLSGISDLKRLLNTCRILQTQVAVYVNKWDLNSKLTEKVEEICIDENIPFLGKVPYDQQVSVALNQGKSIADYDCKSREALLKVYENLQKII